MDKQIRELERTWLSEQSAETAEILYHARTRAGLAVEDLNSDDFSPPGLIPPRFEDYNWREAFAYAGEASEYGCGESDPTYVGTAGQDADPFTRADVKRVIAADEGEPDADSWICLVELWDGRFGYLEAGCDYTGWD